MMSVAFANCSRIEYYNHSHFKWILLITNFVYIKVIKTINNVLYISSFWIFRLWLQGPNQVLTPKAKAEAKALMSKAKDKAKAKD